MVRGLTRYYVLRQLGSKPSKYGQWALAVLRTLQLLTLLFPLYSTQEDPWAFASFWPCWYVLNIVGRQDRMLRALLSPVRVVEFLYVALVLWRLCTLGVSVLYYGLKSKSAYWQLVDAEREHSLGRWLGRADQGAIFLLSGLLAIPAVNVLAEAALCRSDCEEVYLVGIIALPAALVCILADRFFLVDISWKANNDGPISPRFSLFLTISELSAAIAVASPLSSNLVTPTVLLLCGVVKVAVVYYALPFYSPLRNLAESSQGVGLLWEAGLCLLVQAIPAASLAPALLLLSGLPVLFAVNFTMLRSHTDTYLQQGISTEAQYARAILGASKLPKKSVDMQDSLQLHPQLGGADLSGLELYPLLWTAYYYLGTEEYYFAKVTMGLIAEKSRNWQNAVVIETCVARLYRKLRESEKDEMILQQFLLLSPLLEKIQRNDYITTTLIRDFDECIEWKSSSFDRLVQIARKAAHFSAKTAKLYQRAIKTFPTKASLVQQFASFLEMMGKLQEAEKFSNRASKLSHKTHKKTTISSQLLLEDDPNCLILVTSVTGSAKGNINWCINGSLLGYSIEDLREMNCSALLPSGFHRQWTEMLGSLATQRAVPYTSHSDEPLHFLLVNRQAELVSGAGRVFLSNDRETGRLMGIALVRVEETSKDMALLSPYGELMEGTASFTAFKRETAFLSECNWSRKDLLWKGHWRGSQLIVSEEAWEVCGQLHLPCISLFRMRSRQSTTSDFSVISETHIAHYGKSAALFHSLFSTVTVDTDWLQRSVENSQIVRNKTLSQAQVIKQRVKRLNKWLLLALVLAIMAGSAVALTVVESFSVSVQEINQAIAGITAVGMRVLSISAAIRSKELFLVASGFSLYGNETAAKANLDSISVSLGQMHASLHANLSTATGFYQQQLITPINPFWRYENGRFRKYEMTLLDVMDEMARRSASLANCSLASVTERNSDFMTLYRNGVEEALVAFNASVGAFAASKDRARAEVLQTVELAA